MLTIRALGTLAISFDACSYSILKEQNRTLLLVYLAEHERPSNRKTIARMLWPDVEDPTALTNLRSLLMRMRRDGLGSYLVADRYSLSLDPTMHIEYDVRSLRRAVGTLDDYDLAALSTAMQVYEGPFLAGVTLMDHPETEQWVRVIREEVNELAVAGYRRLVDLAVAAGQTSQAVGFARRLLDIVPYDDRNNAAYMRLLAQDGRPTLALRYYETYRRALAQEFDVDRTSPVLERTLSEIYERAAAEPPSIIEPEAGGVSSVTQAKLPVPEPMPTDLPADAPLPITTVVGREREARWVESLLDQGTRLITIVGMGGIGKTAFLQSRIPSLKQRFGGRVVMVDLRGQMPADTADPAASAEAVLLSAAADDLDLERQPGAPLFTQVQAALTPGPVCLLLDNFETILPAAPTLWRLLEATPGLTIFVTSRHMLNLRGEAKVVLDGLGVRAEEQKAAGVSEAATLFLRRALHVQPKQVIDSWDRDLVEQFCRQLGGHPLALELATLQLDLYGLAELVSSTASDLALLRDDLAAYREEQASVNHLLETMWATLSPDAQRVLAEISVFAGAFHRDALRVVAPAPTPVYRELLYASLLRTEPEPSWFSLHPLVKQTATRRLLATSPDSKAYVRHAQFMLGQIDLEMWKVRRYQSGQQQDDWMYTVRHYSADVFAAWHWAAKSEEWELLSEAVMPLGDILRNQLRFREAIMLIEPVIEQLSLAEDRTRIQQHLAGRAALALSWLHHYGNDYQQMIWSERAVAWLEAADLPWESAVALIHQVFLLRLGRRDSSLVKALLERSTTLIEAHDLQELRSMNLSARLSQQTVLDSQHIADAEPYLDQLTDMSTWLMVLLAAMGSDDWELVDRYLARFIQFMETPDGAGCPWGDVLANYVRANLQLSQGNREAALATYRSINTDQVLTSEWHSYFAFINGQMALWQQAFGDEEHARCVAKQVLVALDNTVDPYLPDWGRLQLAAYYFLTGNRNRATHLCLHLVARWRNESEIHPIFVGSLYLLVRLHREQMPESLFLKVVKLGAVSPVLHYTLRFLARDFAAEEGIKIVDEEREAILAMDQAAAEALLEDLVFYLPQEETE